MVLMLRARVLRIHDNTRTATRVYNEYIEYMRDFILCGVKFSSGVLKRHCVVLVLLVWAPRLVIFNRAQIIRHVGVGTIRYVR